jgi:predicted dehydrogenase
MTASEIEIPMLAWAKRPWHMIEESVFKTCAHLLSALKTGSKPATSGRDNLKTYAICEAAYESNATGQAIPPREA